MMELLLLIGLLMQSPQETLDYYFPQERVIEKSIVQVEVEEEYDIVLAKVTAYAPHDNVSGMCNNDNPNATSTGAEPKVGTAAVDPSKIPYGSKIYVDGYGYATAEDTGGALRNYDGYAIDLYFKTHKEAIQWGVKYIKIKIYKEK